MSKEKPTVMISPSPVPLPIAQSVPYMNCILCNKSLHVSVVDHVCIGRDLRSMK